MKFDLEARMSPASTPAEIQGMARRLLESRFMLRTHVERRAVDVFVLSLAKPGKLGPNMTPAAPDCVKWRVDGGRIPGGCDVSRRRGGAAGGLTLSAGTIDDLITVLASGARIGLAGVIDRPVIDRTGLSGYFDMAGPSGFVARGGGDVETNGSFFTLMREQLGLKFSPGRETVDVLVIDSASLPDPN